MGTAKMHFGGGGDDGTRQSIQLASRQAGYGRLSVMGRGGLLLPLLCRRSGLCVRPSFSTGVEPIGDTLGEAALPDPRPQGKMSPDKLAVTGTLTSSQTDRLAVKGTLTSS